MKWNIELFNQIEIHLLTVQCGSLEGGNLLLFRLKIRLKLKFSLSLSLSHMWRK